MLAYQVIIPAAGRGKRMGTGFNKLFLKLGGIPVLVHTLQVFDRDDMCKGIILSISPSDEEHIRKMIGDYRIKKVTSIVYGGKERQDSVYNGLKAVNEREGIILVHDGARPFIRREYIHACVRAAAEKGAAIIAVPVKDTIKKVKGDIVMETIERSGLWAVQTPQAFRISLLRKAYQKAMEDHFTGTDDASLVERLNWPVAIVEGDYDNIKLTTLEDLYFAEAILKKKQADSQKQIFHDFWF